MRTFTSPLSIDRIIELIGGQYSGASTLMLDNVAEAKEANARSVIFIEKEKYLEAAISSQAGLIICSKDFSEHFEKRNIIVTDTAYFLFMKLVSVWLGIEDNNYQYLIHETAVINERTILDTQVGVGAYTVIEKGVCIGNKTRIDAHCYIGQDVTIGSNCIIYPGVKIYSGCKLGDNVIIHSGSVIGADGFGYLPVNGLQIKIPQVGNVVIESDVEIGANTTIDRSTIGSTIIGQGTKIDNLVQIGHNCVIGKNCIICAQVGLAGNTTTGNNIYLAGQVGAAGHIHIGDRAMIGAQSGISSSVPDDAKYLGYPARDANLTKRIMAAEQSLPDMYKAFIRQKREHKES